MKKSFSLFTAFCVAILFAVSANAQLALPQASSKASVMQTVGLTEITIEYSSPAVKGRTIWGDLVPYDEVWRAGANAATKVTFSEDVKIGGKEVKKGSYSLFVIPRKSADWSIILNSNPAASASARKANEDVVEVKVKPVTVSHRENLSYSISDFTDSRANIALEWEKQRLPLVVETNTATQAEANIGKLLNSSWRDYNNAARYMIEKGNLDKAMEYVNTSIALNEVWWNHWVKAQILHQKGMNKDAYTHAQKAKELGDKNPQGFFFQTDVEQALKTWKKS